MNASHRRLLIIDDEPEILDLIKEFFEDKMDLIETASNASQAFEALSKTRFDVIISDYLMPGMNGLEILKVLRETETDIPVIWVTGAGGNELFEEAWRWGAFDYLTKPFKLTALSEIVEKALCFGRAFAEDVSFRRVVNEPLAATKLIIPAKLQRRLEEIARKDNLSLSTLIATILEASIDGIPHSPIEAPAGSSEKKSI